MSSTPTLPTHPSGLQVRILASTYTLEILAIICVSLRVYFRVKQFKKLTLTDAFLVCALLQQIGVQICNVFEVLLTLQQYQDKHLPKLATIDATFIWYSAFWCLRMSIALLFLEIFSFRPSKMIIHISMVVITVTMIVCLAWKGACTFPLYNSPNPLAAIFAKCIHQGFITLTINCFVGLIFDLGVVILPMIPIWSLHMSTTKKISVTFVFALGWITVAASTIRLTLAMKSLIGGPLKPGMQSNFTIFGAVEMHVGLIASSLLTLWRVIRLNLLAPVGSKVQSWTLSVRGSRPSLSASRGNSGSGSERSSDFTEFQTPKDFVVDTLVPADRMVVRKIMEVDITMGVLKEEKSNV